MLSAGRYCLYTSSLLPISDTINCRALLRTIESSLFANSSFAAQLIEVDCIVPVFTASRSTRLLLLEERNTSMATSRNSRESDLQLRTIKAHAFPGESLLYDSKQLCCNFTGSFELIIFSRTAL